MVAVSCRSLENCRNALHSPTILDGCADDEHCRNGDRGGVGEYFERVFKIGKRRTTGQVLDDKEDGDHGKGGQVRGDLFQDEAGQSQHQQEDHKWDFPTHKTRAMQASRAPLPCLFRKIPVLDLPGKQGKEIVLVVGAFLRFVGTGAEGNGVGFLFLFPGHHHVRHFHRLSATDLGAELVTLGVKGGAETVFLAEAEQGIGVFLVLFADGENADLLRGEPKGEVAGEMFDQHADKPLH